jgi:membrane protein implicated in regulation of membrane protease activity
MYGMSLNINQMLGRCKIPFTIVIAILFSIEIAFGITRALITVTGVLVTTMITINSSIYSAVSLAFAIFFFVTAGKLMVVLGEKSKREKSKRSKNLQRYLLKLNGRAIYFHQKPLLMIILLDDNTHNCHRPMPRLESRNLYSYR